MRKTKILMTTLAVAALAIGCGAFAACGEKGTAYEITFNANGGTYAEGATTVKLKTDKKGRLAAKPTTDPTYTGYSFTTYNTAEDGSGSEVTYGVSGYQFKANTIVYAQWEPEAQVEAGLYTTDGTLIAELEESIPGDSATKQYGSAAVPLAPGDVFQIKINGETLTHTSALGLWTASGCHGINFDQSAATFTVKPGAERNFEIYAKYYEDAPCWSIYVTDNLPDVLVPGGAYLVGGKGWDNASWDISADNYINPETGLKVTFTNDAEFKITNCLDVTTGENRGWAYNVPSYYKMATGKETGYLNFSSIGADGSGSVLAAGEYTITIKGEGANMKFVFTPDDSIQPNVTLTYVDRGFYLVGTGFKTKDANNEDKNAQWNLVKEFYIDPDGSLEIECTKNNKIKLIASNADAPVWDVYSKNECYTVSVTNSEYRGREDEYISFSGGEGTVNTAGTYTVTITVGEESTAYPFGKPTVTFTPKGNLAPDESEQVLHYFIKGGTVTSWDNGIIPAKHEFEETAEGSGIYQLSVDMVANDQFMFAGFAEDAEGNVVMTTQVAYFNNGNTTLTDAVVEGNTKYLEVEVEGEEDPVRIIEMGKNDANYTTKQAGTYTFTLDVANKTLSVTFTPAAPTEGGDGE